MTTFGFLRLFLLLLSLVAVVNCLRVNSFFSKAPSLKLSPTITQPAAIVESYFSCWNKRDMDGASSLFSEDCIYEDTLYPGTFQGTEEVRFHLERVANALPENFQFCVDEISDVATDSFPAVVGVQWHVEADGKPLPFTRGSSVYTVSKEGKIVKGFDVPEPVLKSGNISLKILETASNIITEPIRIIPISAWVIYCYFLFLSDQTPGVNALQLDPDTWTMVKDLSFNFWLILPIFFPSSVLSASIHPGLEAIFNMVIVWAGLYLGFASDGRSPRKSMVPTLGIMQFLTNAAFMPYLFTREPERLKEGKLVSVNELSAVEKIGESKLLPIVLGAVGTTCIYWFFNGRIEEYGDLPVRIESLKEIISHDRLAFSFCVDLLYYSVFQGWLVSDDLKRRGMAEESFSAQVARYVPFYGLVYYFLTRDELLQDELDNA